MTAAYGYFVNRTQRLIVLAPIVVGNNVFVGSDSLILPGVTIGDNVVIGAGSVVSKDIPSDCVAVGVPAKPIKSISEYASKVVAHSDKTKGDVAERKEIVLFTKVRGRPSAESVGCVFQPEL